MTVALANALRKGCFAYMNGEKGNNLTRADRMERKVTSYCQDISAADETLKVVKETTKGSKCVDALSRTMNASKTTSKVLEWAGKGANIASQAVNPILCVASAARAWSAEDKKSAIIQESGAMLGMFAFEGVAKSAMGLAEVKNPVSRYLGKGLRNLVTKYLPKIPNNKYTAILKAVGFVAASLIGFEAGHILGKAVTKNTTEKQFEALKLSKLQKEQEQFAQLTAPQDGVKANIMG